MIDSLMLLRWLHMIGATVLLGTGIGIAFFMLMAHRTREPQLIAHVTTTVVVADYVFTATAVVAQPITGLLLANQIGWPLSEPWLITSVLLYVLTGVFWLPVVWMQTRMRNLAREAASSRQPLPPQYHRLYGMWFLCGMPAFCAVLAIVWLMVAKPSW